MFGQKRLKSAGYRLLLQCRLDKTVLVKESKLVESNLKFAFLNYFTKEKITTSCYMYCDVPILLFQHGF